MSWLDLHMHSQISLDGEFSPERLAEICHDSGLKVVALSDHNSVRGVERMMTACSRFGIREIPAVELDCIFEGVDLHLLGYGIDFQDPRYRELEEDILSQKKKNSSEVMKILKDTGIFFEEEKVLAMSRDGGCGRGKQLRRRPWRMTEIQKILFWHLTERAGNDQIIPM